MCKNVLLHIQQVKFSSDWGGTVAHGHLMCWVSWIWCVWSHYYQMTNIDPVYASVSAIYFLSYFAFSPVAVKWKFASFHSSQMTLQKQGLNYDKWPLYLETIYIRSYLTTKKKKKVASIKLISWNKMLRYSIVKKDIWAYEKTFQKIWCNWCRAHVHIH